MTPRRIAWRRIAIAALPILPSLVRVLCPDGRLRGQEWVARNPRRADRHSGSFSINVRNGRWADFATGDQGGDAISLVAYLADISQAEAAKQLAAKLGIDPHE